MKKASLTTLVHLRKTLKLNPKSPIPISSNHIFAQNPSKPTFTSQNHDYPSKPYFQTPPKTLSFLHFSSNPYRRFTTSVDPQKPISQISSSQQKINELGEAFEKAETASQMIEVFEKMEPLIDGNQLGPLLFKIGHKLDLQGDSPDRVFDYADKCLKILDLNENLSIKGNEHSLALAMCLRLLGSACLGLRRFNEGLGYLNRANRIVGKLDEAVHDSTVKHVLHAVHLYLARTKIAMGRRKDAIGNMKKCLEIKEMMLEKNSMEMGNAYREMAEAYVVLSNFGEALPYCEKALEIHKVQLGSNLVEVGPSRRLLGVIYTGLEQHEKALEQNQLSQKAMQNWSRMMDQLRAEFDAANMQIASGKSDKAINTLKGLVLQTDKESEDRAKIFVSMAKALCNQDKFLEAKGYLQIACGILDKKEKKSPSEASKAYLDISKLYESMNEFGTAISILKKILTMLEKVPNEQRVVGTASARIGKLLLSTGKVKESIPYLQDATKLLREHFEVGYVYYNLGFAYLELDRPQSAAQVFATAKDIMDISLGPHHVDSIKACQNLSKAYSAMKSYALAINFQEKAIEAWSGLASRAQDELKEAQRVLHQLKVKDCGESADN